MLGVCDITKCRKLLCIFLTYVQYNSYIFITDCCRHSTWLSSCRQHPTAILVPLVLVHYCSNVNHYPEISITGDIIIWQAHSAHFQGHKQPNLFHYRLPEHSPVLCGDTSGWREWGWMVGLGMLGACRLSSIWAGRCTEEKTTTQRARSPSGDQFMVLAQSLSVKKQISWFVFKRPTLQRH